MNFNVALQKEAGKQLNNEKMADQLGRVLQRIHAGGRQQRGWKAIVKNVTVQGYKPYVYTAHLELTYTPKQERSPQTIQDEFRNITGIISNAGKFFKWKIIEVQGQKIEESSASALSDKSIGYIPVEYPKEYKKSFSHIFERDPQIDIVMSALEAATSTNWVHRFHTLLYGDPASGKTEICLSLEQLVGEQAVLKMDATSTTQAGAIKDLNERDELPRILIIEEIEKSDESSLRWLLGVMDFRGEIRKLTNRDQIQRSVKLLVVATCNDYQLLRSMMYGALASRFAHKVYCPRPSRSLLEKILRREIEKTGGKVAWIKPALDYAEEIETSDPRQVLAICLSGRDQLLNGSYQKKLKAVQHP